MVGGNEEEEARDSQVCSQPGLYLELAQQSRVLVALPEDWHPQSISSQSPITLVPRNPMFFSGGYPPTHTHVYIHTHKSFKQINRIIIPDAIQYFCAY